MLLRLLCNDSTLSQPGRPCSKSAHCSHFFVCDQSGSRNSVAHRNSSVNSSRRLRAGGAGPAVAGLDRIAAAFPRAVARSPAPNRRPRHSTVTITRLGVVPMPVNCRQHNPRTIPRESVEEDIPTLPQSLPTPEFHRGVAVQPFMQTARVDPRAAAALSNRQHREGLQPHTLLNSSEMAGRGTSPCGICPESAEFCACSLELTRALRGHQRSNDTELMDENDFRPLEH